MIVNMYAVFDRAVNAFNAPFCFRNKGEAVRSFMDACSDGTTNFCKHPNDFALYYLGTYDDSCGRVEQDVNGPQLVITADDCIRNSAVTGGTVS